MTDIIWTKAETVAVKPVVVVHRQPWVPGVSLASGTFNLPFEVIRPLLSEKPLRRPYRGEQVIERPE